MHNKAINFTQKMKIFQRSLFLFIDFISIKYSMIKDLSEICVGFVKIEMLVSFFLLSFYKMFKIIMRIRLICWRNALPAEHRTRRPNNEKLRLQNVCIRSGSIIPIRLEPKSVHVCFFSYYHFSFCVNRIVPTVSIIFRGRKNKREFFQLNAT